MTTPANAPLAGVPHHRGRVHRVPLVQDMIPALQALAGLAWLAVFFQRLPGVIRLFGPKPSAMDIYGSPLPLVGLVQAGFSARWWVWGQTIAIMEPLELLFWGGLYLASTVSAALFFIMFYRHPAAARK